MSQETPVHSNDQKDPPNASQIDRPTVLAMQSQNVTPDLAVESHKRSRQAEDPSSKRTRRALFSQPQDDDLESSQQTVQLDYTQQSQTVEEQFDNYFLVDTKGNQTVSLVPIKVQDYYTVYAIDRHLLASIHVEPYRQVVGRHHAKLLFDNVSHTFQLQADQNPCWILNGPKWSRIDVGQQVAIEIHQTFRLLPPSSNSQKGVQFTLSRCQCLGNQILCGSGSFDYEYLQLLRRIKAYGQEQCNKKGSSLTLREQYTLTISLQSADKCLLPITTLRNLYMGQKSLIEALWYIRGEHDIHFLQRHHCTFWDAQATNDGFVGLNYGLLTNFPTSNGQSYNQLLSKVIEPLCQNKSSRNMLCSLSNPGEETVQQACSSSVQFAVANSQLDLTVNQRSSDVILGLPHDVIVWSIILHLVRREVYRRSGRQLAAGKLHFAIAAGGAHVYTINKDSFDELLTREPMYGVQPYMVVDAEKDIFELARNYERQDVRIPGYTKKHPSIKIEQANET